MTTFTTHSGLVSGNGRQVSLMAGVEGSEQTSGPAAKKHQDEETQGLEKVTDYVEEQENSAELGQVS